MIVGALVAALSFWFDEPWIFFAGLAIAALGLLVGKLMSMAGLGPMPVYTEQAPERTRLEGPTRSAGTEFPQ